MYENVTAQDNIAGRYADNDLATGTLGTRIEAREQNAVFFEIVNAIKEARLSLNGNDESQLAQAMVLIAKRESGMNVLEVEMSSSPQNVMLSQHGIPHGNYVAQVTLQGNNPHDITLSYRLQEQSLTLYAWYTNREGKRVQGVPMVRSGGAFGLPFGSSFGGSVEGDKTKISIFLTAR